MPASQRAGISRPAVACCNVTAAASPSRWGAAWASLVDRSRAEHQEQVVHSAHRGNAGALLSLPSCT